MFEARLLQSGIFKKLIDSIKDLVSEVNFDVSESGIQLQALDTSHVALVSLVLRSDGFDHYRCDRSLSLGVNLSSLTKVLKCAGGEDVLTMKAQDEPDTLTIMFESPENDRISEFEVKLMDIDSEHLGIPEMEYGSVVGMPSGEFQRIIRDLTTIGDTVGVNTSKEAVKFSVKGDIGAGSIMLRPHANTDKPDESTSIHLEEPVDLQFALRYLNHFTKATPLSGQVTLSLSQESPLVTEYKIADMGYVRYYLAPKVDDQAAA